MIDNKRTGQSEPRIVQYVEFDLLKLVDIGPNKLVRRVEDPSRPYANPPIFATRARTFTRQEVTAPDGEVLAGARRNVSPDVSMSSLHFEREFRHLYSDEPLRRNDYFLKPINDKELKPYMDYRIHLDKKRL